MIRVDHEQAADLVGAEVEVYRNLHRGLWSVRLRASRRVVAHPRTVVVERATFHVQPGGRARAVRDGRKNVHAWVRGVYADPDFADLSRALYGPGAGRLSDGRRVRAVRYDLTHPCGGFYVVAAGLDQRPLTTADALYFTSDGAYAVAPRETT